MYLYRVDEIIISVSGLTKQHQPGQLSGIRDVSFEIKRGAVVAVIGESGSGKSTLLKTIYGLLKADEGQVLFNGKRVPGPDEQLIPGHREMKIVTQDFSLNIYAKVYDNIACMLSNTDVKGKQEKTLAIMQHLHIEHLSQKKITELSGGEQQRVAIARALVTGTQLLLLDEPFSQVDALLKNQLRADIRKIVADTGLTVILVSHDPADGLVMGDQLLLIRNGRLIQQGSPQAVYHAPGQAYTAQLLGNANVLEAAAAALAGIASGERQIAFYPEWVEVADSGEGLEFVVSDSYFKGFYEELLLERAGVQIRAIQLQQGRYKKNGRVLVNISRFLEF